MASSWSGGGHGTWTPTTLVESTLLPTLAALVTGTTDPSATIPAAVSMSWGSWGSLPTTTGWESHYGPGYRAKWSDWQKSAVVITERFVSALSLAGCLFIFLTFTFSPKFRKPINHLIFYASWGNAIMNVGTLLSYTPIRAPFGPGSAFCQAQGFLIQMFLPADAMWNLSMALNIYLAVFRRWDSVRLRKLDPLYVLVNYGVTFVVALVFCFVDDVGRKGKIYGGGNNWCWISYPWASLRLACCYVPAWICILLTFAIYVYAGWDIFRRRKQLQTRHSDVMVGDSRFILENPFTAVKTTEVHITSELVDLSRHVHGRPSMLGLNNAWFDIDPDTKQPPYVLQYASPRATGHFQEYSVSVETPYAFGGPSPPFSSSLSSPSSLSPPLPMLASPKNATMEANAAAWGYLRTALLYFITLLITWIPSSISDVYSVVNRDRFPWGFTLAAGIVLPLVGFWNALIYVSASWDAVKSLFLEDLNPANWRRKPWASTEQRSTASESTWPKEERATRRAAKRSTTESLKGLTTITKT